MGAKIILLLVLAGIAGELDAQVTLPNGPKLVRPAALFEQRKFREATQLLLEIPEESGDYAGARYYLGRIAVEQKKYDESVSRFEEAVTAHGDIAEYHNWLGVMYGVIAMEANPIRQAVLAPKIKNEFEKAASIEPENIQTQWGLVNYYSKAPGFLGGIWDKALKSAKVIGTHSRADGLRAMGVIHAAQKKSAIAEKEYQDAIALAPGDPENQFALARFYVDEKEYDYAFRVYETVLKNYHPSLSEPSYSGDLLALGAAYEKRRDYAHAAASYYYSLQLEQGLAEAKAGLKRLNN